MYRMSIVPLNKESRKTKEQGGKMAHTVWLFCEVNRKKRKKTVGLMKRGEV